MSIFGGKDKYVSIFLITINKMKENDFNIFLFSNDYLIKKSNLLSNF